MTTQKIERIDSSDHATLKLVTELKSRNHRDKHQMFIAEGVRQVLAAKRGKPKVLQLVYSPKLLTSSKGKKVRRKLTELGVPTYQTSPELYREVSGENRASGLIAVVSFPLTVSTKISKGVWLATRHLQSFGNLGTALRTLSAFGGAGLVLFGETVDPFHTDVVRASMGGVFSLDIVRTTHRKFDCDALVVGLDAKSSTAIWDESFAKDVVFILGHERHGLSDEDLGLCDRTVNIPMTGLLNSINVGVAASIALYEAQRQLGQNF